MLLHPPKAWGSRSADGGSWTLQIVTTEPSVSTFQWVLHLITIGQEDSNSKGQIGFASFIRWNWGSEGVIRADLEGQAASLTRAIGKAARVAIPRFKTERKINDKPVWWSRELTESKRELNYLRRSGNALNWKRTQLVISVWETGTLTSLETSSLIGWAEGGYIEIQGLKVPRTW